MPEKTSRRRLLYYFTTSSPLDAKYHVNILTNALRVKERLNCWIIRVCLRVTRFMGCGFNSEQQDLR
uniref:Uncharacterized protein n=1 Tax=Helianthus annuus TaxID=4232 RepID=A0A251S4R1_HELAN